MMSRHAAWALLFPALLPLLIAFYALWARFPRLHARLPDPMTSVVVWGAVLDSVDPADADRLLGTGHLRPMSNPQR